MLKKRTKAAKKEKAKTEVQLGALGDVAAAKAKDFDLDLGAATWQGKKGQAGTRTRAGGA